jgi:cell division septum initiation protein DivIVA
MITSNIAGGASDGSQQLFSLIGLISDPNGYTQKLKDLQDAADRNQKYVELVAPAEDILTLKDKAVADANAASAALADAKTQAAQIVADAKSQAAALLADANVQAAQIVNDTQSANADAKAKVSDLNNQIAAAKSSQAASDKAAADYNAQFAILVSKQKDLDFAIASAVAAKQNIVDAHKAFIESIS